MKWMRERKWYLKTMAVGFIGSFFLLFLFYRQAALCFLGAVLGSVCYVRYRIKVQKEQEKWQLMVEFKEAMDSMVSALAAGYSMENAITEAYRDMKLLHSEDTRMMRELGTYSKKFLYISHWMKCCPHSHQKVVWKILSLSHKFMRRQEKAEGIW